MVAVQGQFEPQRYGFALQPKSDIRKQVNTALMDVIEDGTYDKIYSKWFGTTP